MRANRQRVMHCPCGNAKVLALGLCSTCYTLKRQDEEYFGGLREAVLEHNGKRCRVCDASGRDKRSIIVTRQISAQPDVVVVSGLPCKRSIEQRRSFQPCLRLSWSCGESSTLQVTNRCSLTSPQRSLRLSSFLCSETNRSLAVSAGTATGPRDENGYTMSNPGERPRCRLRGHVGEQRHR